MWDESKIKVRIVSRINKGDEKKRGWWVYSFVQVNYMLTMQGWCWLFPNLILLYKI